MKNKMSAAKIKKLLGECLEFAGDLDAITAQTSFTEELGMNSVSFISFLVALEEECGISIDEEDLDVRNFENLQALANLLGAKYSIFVEN